MTESLLLLNFSGIYDTQDFYQSSDYKEICLKELEGCNCYCDGGASSEIIKKTMPFKDYKIRFLDSGNYHYVSNLLAAGQETAYSLVVLDHHTDMQPPAFGGLLSCGGWIRELLEQDSLLKEVWIAGPPEEELILLSEEFGDRLHVLGEENALSKESLSEFWSTIPEEEDLYISLDKDVLSEEDLKCNWSQGKLRFSELKTALRAFCLERKEKIRFFDVCGEEDSSKGAVDDRSNQINREIVQLLKEVL